MGQDENENKPEGFSAYILLSDSLQFSTTEIEEALLEDFPTLDIRADAAMSMAQVCDTDEFITAPILLGGEGADAGSVVLIRLPGYGTWDPAHLSPWQRLRFPDVDAAFAANASYISVTVGAQAHDDTSQFRAARLCSCLAAVFAKLPIAVAVYWASADQFLSPDDTVEMANRAIADEFPIEQWIGLRLDAPQGENATPVMGVTQGVKNFTGSELCLATAPVEMGEVASILLTTATMVVSLGHYFHDGDTIGASGQSEGDSYRIRHAPAGTWGGTSDLWLLVHPQSPVKHEKLLGKIKKRKEQNHARVERRSIKGFFKSLLRRNRGA